MPNIAESNLANTSRPPKLTPRHIKNLRVVTTRFKLLMLLPSNGIVAEAEVDEGNYSQKILALNKPRKLHLIDSCGSERFGEDKLKKVEGRFNAEVESGQVVINRGISHDELETFPDAYFDWVYLDTSHVYENTFKELVANTGATASTTTQRPPCRQPDLETSRLPWGAHLYPASSSK
jgi:hypothetical protein